MHQKYKSSFKHDFGQGKKTAAERRTFIVMLLTLATMVAEIAAGLLTNSMALLADGIHMGGHALALGLAFLGYYFVRRFANDRRFVFGSGKISELVAYTTSILLFITTMLILYESVLRILHPEPILAMQAFVVAFVGLVINLLSAWILSGSEFEHAHQHAHSHGHDHLHALGHVHAHAHGHVHMLAMEHEHEREHDCCHEHDHEDDHDRDHDLDREAAPDMAMSKAKEKEKAVQRDHNLQGALMHVLADAATSVAAMIGIVCAWAWHWYIVDPLIAMCASVVIFRWSVVLMRETSVMLLDASDNEEIKDRIKEMFDREEDTELIDLHVWAVGQNAWTMVAAVVHHGDKTPEDYKRKLAGIEGLYHPVVEVQLCHGCED